MKPWHALAPVALAVAFLLPGAPALAVHAPVSPQSGSRFGANGEVYASALSPSAVNLGVKAFAAATTGPTITVTINGVAQQLALPANLSENTTYTIQLSTIVNGQPVILPPVSFYVNTSGTVVNTPAPTHTPAPPHTESAALRLENALRGLQIEHVSLLFAYLESIQLSPAQVGQIDLNAAKIPGLFGNITNPNELSTAQKTEAVNLFVSSANEADLQVVPVLADGQPVNLVTYVATPNNPLQIDLEDESGSVLAVIQPEYYDVATPELESFIKNVAIAASAAYQLEHSGQFVEIPHGHLP